MAPPPVHECGRQRSTRLAEIEAALADVQAAPQAAPPLAEERLVWKADEYLAEAVPGWQSMSQEDIHDLLTVLGATDDRTRQQVLDNWNRSADLLLGPGVHVIGRKPRAGDGVYTVDIPHSDLAIRMWDGGMEMYRQFCLDFFDTRARRPVNMPRGFELWPSAANAPGVYTMAGPLGSLERGFGLSAREVPQGEEKFCVLEGSCVTLVRRDRPQEPFTFAVPARQREVPAGIAQPRFRVVQ
ncbi:hypothetical protein VTO73DRAFT_4207 [Trametes versicolor]